MPQFFGRIGALAGRAVRPLAPYADQVRRRVAPAWAAGQGWYEKREPREKVLLRLAGAILAVILIYALIYSPIVDLRDSLNDRVTARRTDLLAIRSLMHRYTVLQNELKSAQGRTVPGGRNFSLFSVVEQSLTKSIGKDRIASITPSDHTVTGGFRQYAVDVKLNNLSLAQVVDSLYGVQSLSLPITVSNLRLHQHPQETHVYDADLTCIALGKDS